jgi:transcription antitermination factor NusG
METGQSERQWFALRVTSRHEKVVAAAAHQKGFEEFLPLCKSWQRWSDRLQPVSVPLFPGYVFCRLNPEYRLPLLTIPGVLNFVGVGKIPVPIDDAEIAAIQIAVRSELRTKLCPFPEGGNRVRLDNGPLAGLEGFLVETREQQQVVVALTVLKRSVAVDIEHHWVRSLGTPHNDPGQVLVNSKSSR